MKISWKNKAVLSFLAIIPAGIQSWAQTASDTPVAPEAASGGNMLQTALVITAIVLLFVLWGLGQSLVAISKIVRERQKQKTLVLLMISFFSLFFTDSIAQTATTESVPPVAENFGGLSSTTFYALTGVIMIEIIAILFLSFVIKRMYEELLPEQAAGESYLSKLTIWWSNMDKKIFTKATPVEQEADVMLDHDYDGIRELDNALPPWWKYGFYITIVIGVIYMFNFHVMGIGKNPTQEYTYEMELAQQKKEQYEAMNKDKIDENNVPMENAAGIASGSELYHQPGMCLSCHGANGEGGAGPNLTDDYWIHKGSLNDIYHSIKVGYPDKGMQSWEKSFSPKQISQLTSYIKSIKGTNPANALPPKGDLWVDSGTDTTTVKKDSANIK